jgi:glutamate/aspartate transport system substrate-binding protein
MCRILHLTILAFFTCLVSASAQTSIPSDSRLKSIVENKAIRIAYRTDATPFSFKNEKGEPAGFSLDLCQLVTKSIGQQFGIPAIKIEWIPVTVQTRFSAISSGQADLECGSSTITLGRMKEVDFSNVTFVESTGVVVARAANFQTFSDMAGKKIAVVAGTTNEAAVNEQSRAHNLNISVVTVKDREEGISALESGKVDGYASDKLLLVGTQTKQPETLVMLPDDLSIEAYAIALPRGDWALRLAVNTGLASVFRSGLIFAGFKTWFGQMGIQPGVLPRAAWALGALSN